MKDKRIIAAALLAAMSKIPSEVLRKATFGNTEEEVNRLKKRKVRRR